MNVVEGKEHDDGEVSNTYDGMRDGRVFAENRLDPHLEN